MKKTLFVLLLVAAGTQAFSQKARLNAYGGYVFDDGYGYYLDGNTYYNGTIKGGAQWGGGLEFMANPSYGVELLYMNHAADAPTTFKSGIGNAERRETFDLSLNYAMVSFNRYQAASDKVEGYGGLMLGALFSSLDVPSTGNSSSRTSFAWGAKLGTNIWASPKVGIKLQALFIGATSATGGDYYFSYYGPVYLTTYSSLYQFSLGGGLVFKLGK